MDLNIELCKVSLDKKRPISIVNWDKLSFSAIVTFRDNMSKKLDEKVVFHSLLRGNKCCPNDSILVLVISNTLFFLLNLPWRCNKI